jgi:hypothetical protein
LCLQLIATEITFRKFLNEESNSSEFVATDPVARVRFPALPDCGRND